MWRARIPPILGGVLGLLVLAGWIAASLVSPSPAGDAGPPARGAGSPTVTLSPDAAAHAEGDVVRAALQRHYDAINARDYARWTGTVVAQRAAALDEQAWQQAYRSTRVGTVRVDRIDIGSPIPEDPAPLVARVSFVSTQNLADAPEQARAERVCWLSSLPLVGPRHLIGQTGGGSSVPRPC